MQVKTKTYTPEQVADILQLNKNTVYDLIKRGEIIAKKLGKVYSECLMGYFCLQLQNAKQTYLTFFQKLQNRYT